MHPLSLKVAFLFGSCCRLQRREAIFDFYTREYMLTIHLDIRFLKKYADNFRADQTA
jgi:hypothetical protein